MMWRQDALEMTLTPKEPGHISIPPLTFGAVGIKRLAPGLEFDVKSIPAYGAALPVGPFTLKCRSTASRHWPTAIVEVSGEGNLAAVRDFKFPKTPYGIIVRPGDLTGLTRYYSVTAHSRDLTEFPKPVLRYFDPATGAAHETTCVDRIRIEQPKELPAADIKRFLVRTAEGRRQTSRPQSARVSDPDQIRTALARWRAVMLVLAGMGVVGVLLSFRA